MVEAATAGHAACEALQNSTSSRMDGCMKSWTVGAAARPPSNAARSVIIQGVLRVVSKHFPENKYHV